MKITLLALGSRGDVQPFAALGIGLMRAGFRVCLATHSYFEEFVRSHSLEFFPVEGNPQAIVEGDDGRAWLETQRNPLKFASGFRDLMGPVLERAMKDGLDACTGSDALLFGGPGYYIGYSIARKLDIPYIQGYLQPVHPTQAFPSALFPVSFKGGGWFNYLTHALGGTILWQLLLPSVNKARRLYLDLPPLTRVGPFFEMNHEKRPVVMGYSPAVLPKPGDWGDWIHVTGYWDLPQHPWQPPQELLTFLDQGPPPVYIGFGSMANRDPKRMAGIAVEALERSGQRGVLLTGWGGLAQADLPPSVFKLDEAPHDWLFPRMSAVVHHGGAGTTAAGLRAGKPAVIIPFFGDQAFWGDRLHELGVAPPPLSQKKLSAASLARALEMALNDTNLHSCARVLGERIRAENGVKAAAKIIQQALLTD
jgi:sterol 3beta-glucosyltransferase